MKKLGLLLGIILWTSTSFGMQEDGLKGRLDTLVDNLQALEKVLLPKPTPKAKEPWKILLAQYMSTLTVQEQTTFHDLSEQEQAERVREWLAAKPTPMPGEPTPIVPTPPVTPPLGDEPGKPGAPVPPAPPFGAPPPPPAPGMPGAPGKAPVVKKPAKPLLPVLSPQELAGKSAEERQRSDALFLQMFLDVSSLEFERSGDMEAKMRELLTALRTEESFLKREELDRLMSKGDGLLAVLKKDFQVDEASKRTRLEELYSVFVNMTQAKLHEQLLRPISDRLSACLFDAKALFEESIEFLVVSYVTAQRGPQPAKNEVLLEPREKSDDVFLSAWQDLANVDEGMGLMRVVRRLNFIRMHPDFLIYQNMLWKSGQQATQTAAGGTLPLLLLLKSPREFKLSGVAAQGVTGATIKYHMFEPDKFDTLVQEKKLALKEAIEWQLVHAKAVSLISLQDFVLARLKKVKSLTGLQGMLRDVLERYPEDTQSLKAQIQQALAQLDPANLQINFAVIADSLQALLKGQVPADIRANIEALIASAMKDRGLLVAVDKALQAKSSEEFIARLIEFTANMPFTEELKARLTSVYRTPGDIYELLVNQLSNKKALEDLRSSILWQIRPYGMLLRVFKHFVDQYKSKPDDKAFLTNNLKMLISSIGVLATPSKLSQLAGPLYAPVIFDIDQFTGSAKAGFYTGQLKLEKEVEIVKGHKTIKTGIYADEKLGALIDAIKTKNVDAAIAFLTELVRKAHGVSVDSADLKQLMTDIQEALSGTYKLGVEPKYIE